MAHLQICQNVAAVRLGASRLILIAVSLERARARDGFHVQVISRAICMVIRHAMTEFLRNQGDSAAPYSEDKA